ncbi:MAG: RluA family pseudouridine synthase [Coriobacteriales bacterium]|jgi:23S rRNA pseudouridine1911/1915/1917 synthase|nr:RluA family pseudouridine synthase [Coriobacteriales bacterium]
MSAHRHIVRSTEQGSRLDALLATREGIVSRAAAVRLIEEGAVALNGATVTSKRRVVLAGDTLTWELAATAPPGLVAEDIPLDIRYEDDDLLVLSKQAGLVCHPAQGHERGTLVNALIAHCGYDKLAQLQGADRPGIVHRLDKDTTGLMLVAKNDQAGELLTEAIRIRAIDRRYLTLVHGSIAPDTGLIDAPIARGEADRTRMVVSDAFRARSSVTTFTTLERFAAGRFDEGYTLLECKLYTGRTHQIRVHLSYTGHPCVGDPLYGSCNRPKAQLGLDRQFLHSWSLSFAHPITAEQKHFIDPLPADLLEALGRIEGESLGRTEAGTRILPEVLAEPPSGASSDTSPDTLTAAPPSDTLTAAPPSGASATAPPAVPATPRRERP